MPRQPSRVTSGTAGATFSSARGSVLTAPQSLRVTPNSTSEPPRDPAQPAPTPALRVHLRCDGGSTFAAMGVVPPPAKPRHTCNESRLTRGMVGTTSARGSVLAAPQSLRVTPHRQWQAKCNKSRLTRCVAGTTFSSARGSVMAARQRPRVTPQNPAEPPRNPAQTVPRQGIRVTSHGTWTGTTFSSSRGCPTETL
jgi:hypothetical protein